MKYFGTDGIRGDEKFLNKDLCYKVGRSVSHLKNVKRVVIGSDTRKSRDYVKLSVMLGLIEKNVEVEDVGIITSGGLSFITRLKHFDLGIMITASHNPPNHNGIKIFNNLGEKISKSMEEEIEKGLNKKNKTLTFGKVKYKGNYIKNYIDFLCSGHNLSGLKVALDTGYGASFKIAPKVFKKLGAKVTSFCSKNCGEKINVKCGATYLDDFQKRVKDSFDIGLSYDGDGDRLFVVTSSGKILNGDYLLYIMAKSLKKENRLKNNGVVVTIMTNLKIVEKLREENINVFISPVGDRNVLEILKEKDLSLGGESSGHIINRNYLPTGDGVLNSILCSEYLKNLESSVCDFELYPQKTVNLPIKNKEKVMKNEEFLKILEEIKEENKSYKIIVRPSGTENVVRITVEGKEIDKIEKIIQRIKEEVLKICVEL